MFPVSEFLLFLSRFQVFTDHAPALASARIPRRSRRTGASSPLRALIIPAPNVCLHLPVTRCRSPVRCEAWFGRPSINPILMRHLGYDTGAMPRIVPPYGMTRNDCRNFVNAQMLANRLGNSLVGQIAQRLARCQAEYNTVIDSGYR